MTKAAQSTEPVLEPQFKVDSISKSAPPHGAEGVWHSYVISQGTNMITGVRAGTHDEVAVLLEQIVERLNERRTGKTRPKAKA